jgi:MoxR-like ATPase
MSNDTIDLEPDLAPNPIVRETAAPVNGFDTTAVEFSRQAYDGLKYQLSKVIVGQADVIEQILIAIFTRNHALLMGVPGLAKTLLISTLAKTLQLSFKRVQFTPDLMPSDITGTEVMHTDPTTGARAFKFLPGPVFSNIVLADEINRTPPKTQASMLEAMQERRVTVGGTTHKLPDPFFVLATQNPLEQEGTYPLPEAQLDRFLFLINVDYPSEAEEFQIMKMGTSGSGGEPHPIMEAAHILYIQEAVREVPVADHVYKYAERIVRCTRPKQPDALDFCRQFLSFGAGPRASLGLIMAAKGHALLQGQVYAGCENVAAVAQAVMRHRIAVNFTAQSEGITPDRVVQEVLAAVPAR